MVVDDDVIGKSGSGAHIPDEWSFWNLVGMGEYFSKEWVCGFATSKIKEESLLVFVHTCWVLKIDIFFVLFWTMLIHFKQ
jgi:hypothetical protein